MFETTKSAQMHTQKSSQIIEHQFKELFTKENGSFHELTEIIDLKLKDMISTLQWEDRIQYLLVGGDVSYSKEIVSLYYKRLRRIWYGPI